MQLFIFYLFFSDIREELWEIRKTCLRESENFLAESGPVEGRGKLIGRDFGVVSPKKNKGVG